MKIVWLIIKREYWTRVRKKSFIFATLLAPLGFAMFFLVAHFIANYSDDKKTVAIVDQNELITSGLKDIDNSLYFKYPKIDEENVQNELAEGNFDVIVVLPKIDDISTTKNVRPTYFSEEVLGLGPRSDIESAILAKLKRIKLEANGLNDQMIKDLNVSVALKYASELADGEDKGDFASAAAISGMFMAFLLYMTLMIYGTMVMKGVAEEKTNRIVEVLASSVKPFQLLLSKIIGIGAVGLTQYALWGILIAITNVILGVALGFNTESLMGDMGTANAGADIEQSEIQAMVMGISQLPWFKMIGAFVLYFLGGYLIYGSLFAAVGSAIDDDGDLQSLTFPITIPIILSFFITMSAFNNPYSGIVTFGSIFPFTSPIVMPSIIAHDLPWWQILLSVVLLVLGFLGTTFIASKIYRTGILMYGKKVTVKELGKWIFYKN